MIETLLALNVGDVTDTVPDFNALVRPDAAAALSLRLVASVTKVALARDDDLVLTVYSPAAEPVVDATIVFPLISAAVASDTIFYQRWKA